MSENIGKNIMTKLSSKYSPGMLVMCQKLLDHPKKSATDTLKTLIFFNFKRFIQKTAEVIGDLIGNKITIRISKVSKNLQQNSSETVTYELDKEITKERSISPEKR